jgi:hypothetical protein
LSRAQATLFFLQNHLCSAELLNVAAAQAIIMAAVHVLYRADLHTLETWYGVVAMALLWDPGKLIWHEKNVDVPGGLKQGSAYDLWFFPELGKPGRGVLVVKVILNFKFKSGPSKRLPGMILNWSNKHKTDFMQGVKDLCENLWTEKHRLTTGGGGPVVDGAGCHACGFAQAWE